MNETLTTALVPFHGGDLSVAQRPDGTVLVSLRQVLERIGVAYDDVYRSIVSRSRRHSWVRHQTQFIDQDGRSRQGLWVHMDDLPMLLVTLSELVPDGPYRRVFETHVRECVDALADYFFRGVAVNERFPPEVVQLRFLEAIERILLAGDVDPRHRIALKEYACNQLSPGKNGPDEKRRWVTVSQRVKELGYPSQRTDWISIGALAAGYYRRKFGRDPIKHDQFVDGAVRSINTYSRDDLKDVLDPAIHQWHRRRGIRPQN